MVHTNTPKGSICFPAYWGQSWECENQRRVPFGPPLLSLGDLSVRVGPEASSITSPLAGGRAASLFYTQVQAGGVWGPELSQEPRGAGLGWFLCWVRLGLPVPSEAPRAAPPRRRALAPLAASSEAGGTGYSEVGSQSPLPLFFQLFLCIWLHRVLVMALRVFSGGM